MNYNLSSAVPALSGCSLFEHFHCIVIELDAQAFSASKYFTTDGGRRI